MIVNDGEWRFLAEQTGMSAPFNDMYFKYLRGLGFTGTLQDMIAAYGYGLSPSRGGAWTPAQLTGGIAEWNAFATDPLIVLNGSKVSSWTDGISSIAVTEGTDSNRPSWVTTGWLSTKPTLSFNPANSQRLIKDPVTGLPRGAGAAATCEIWLLFNQKALPADTSTRAIISFGDTVSQSRITIQRSVNSGVNRLAGSVGNGTTAITSRLDTVDFSGVCWAHAIIEADGFTIGLNGVYGTKQAVVPSIGLIGSNKLTIGCIANVTPGNFSNGDLSYCRINQLSSNDDRDKMRTWIASQTTV